MPETFSNPLDLQNIIQNKLNNYHAAWQAIYIYSNDHFNFVKYIIRNGELKPDKMLLLKVSKEEEIANDLLAESNISKVIKSNWIDKQDNFLLKNILKEVTHLALIHPLYHFLQYAPASDPNLTEEERNQHLPPAYIEAQEIYTKLLKKLDNSFAELEKQQTEIINLKNEISNLEDCYKPWALNNIITLIPKIENALHAIGQELEQPNIDSFFKEILSQYASKYNFSLTIKSQLIRFNVNDFLQSTKILQEKLAEYIGTHPEVEGRNSEKNILTKINFLEKQYSLISTYDTFLFPQAVMAYKGEVTSLLKQYQTSWKKAIDMKDSIPNFPQALSEKLDNLKNQYSFKITPRELNLPHCFTIVKNTIDTIEKDGYYKNDSPATYLNQLKKSWHSYKNALNAPHLIEELAKPQQWLKEVKKINSFTLKRKELAEENSNEPTKKLLKVTTLQAQKTQIPPH